jgi:hypothetical protein
VHGMFSQADRAKPEQATATSISETELTSLQLPTNQKRD